MTLDWGFADEMRQLCHGDHYHIVIPEIRLNLFSCVLSLEVVLVVWPAAKAFGEALEDLREFREEMCGKHVGNIDELRWVVVHSAGPGFHAGHPY